MRIRELVALAAIVAVMPHASSAQGADSGSFRLHKFAQPIGEEQFEIVRSGNAVKLSSTFKFVDRGSAVPLSAHFTGGADLTPVHFDIKGKNSRFASIDDAVDIADAAATIRTDTLSHTFPQRGPFFTIAGYAPVSMQQLLLQYWERHGRPASLAVLPDGVVRIAARGADTVNVGGKRQVLRRFGVDGLIWGRETLWQDSAGRVVALVSIDAEFDHFEGVRDAYEGELEHFISRAAADGAAALAIRTRAALGTGGSFALVGATLIDGTGAAAVPDAVVVVRGDRIVAAGPRSSTPIPAGTLRVDARGKWIVPGLWDMHAHYEQVEWGPIYLAAGVTTVRDVGNELDFIRSVRDANRSGRGVGPQILMAGVIDGKGQYALGVEQADTPERGVELVRQYHDANFQQIKIYSSMKLPVLRAIATEAHRLGMTVTGHVPEGMTAFEAIDAGMDMINHATYIVPMMKPAAVAGAPIVPLDTASAAAHTAIDFLKAHGTVVDPTLAISQWSYHPARVQFSDIEPGVLKIAPELRPQIMNTGVSAAREAWGKQTFDERVIAVAALHRAGVPVVAGTDQAVPGYSLHRELELYVKAGFTPMEAIQAATLVPARAMGVDREVGTITVGKRADLLIVDGDPLARIEDLRRVSLVVAAGKRYTPAPLWRSVGFTP